jgi:hypothetical protein
LVGRLYEGSSQTSTDLYTWAFVSSGLHRLAGGELVMVVTRRTAETPDSYPTDFLHISDTGYDRASSSPLRLRR